MYKRQAQPCSLNTGSIVAAAKRIENVGEEFLCHADARIADYKPVSDMQWIFDWLNLLGQEIDTAAFRRKLYSIAQKIDKNLIGT